MPPDSPTPRQFYLVESPPAAMHAYFLLEALELPSGTKDVRCFPCDNLEWASTQPVNTPLAYQEGTDFWNLIFGLDDDGAFLRVTVDTKYYFPEFCWPGPQHKYYYQLYSAEDAEMFSFLIKECLLLCERLFQIPVQYDAIPYTEKPLHTAFERMKAFLKAEGIPFNSYADECFISVGTEVMAIFNADGSFLKFGTDR